MMSKSDNVHIKVTIQLHNKSCILPCPPFIAPLVGGPHNSCKNHEIIVSMHIHTLFLMVYVDPCGFIQKKPVFIYTTINNYYK